MTSNLIMLYICMKFHPNISNGFQVLDQTQFCDEKNRVPKGLTQLKYRIWSYGSCAWNVVSSCLANVRSFVDK